MQSTIIYTEGCLTISVARKPIIDIITNKALTVFDFTLYENGVFKKKTSIGIDPVKNGGIKDHYDFAIRVLLK